MAKRVVIGVGIVLVVALLVLRIVGFAPKEQRPGLWLPGELVTTPVTDWSFTDAFPTIHLQTRTAYLIPHSVTINIAQTGGQLYIASAHPVGTRRSWNDNVNRDPRVRVGIGDRLYDRKAVPLTDATEIAAVLQAFADKYPFWKRVSEQPADTKPAIYYWRLEPA